MGLSTIQKVSSFICQLVYVSPADSFDDYIKIGETTVIATLKQFFCLDIPSIYDSVFLCLPETDHQAVIMAEYQERRFMVCKGIIDDMHWAWKNCPAGWAGEFEGQ